MTPPSSAVPESLVQSVLLALWRCDDPIAMQELLRQTGAALPQIQQALAILAERKCAIERAPAGLRLQSVGLPCWQDILQATAQMENRPLGRRVLVFQSVTSTSDIAWQYADDPAADGLAILADHQTAGRGRRGHAWHSAPGKSLLLSILLRRIPSEKIERLTLLAGLAAAKSLEGFTAESAAPRLTIKWPNDLLAGNRKIAGILLECRPASDVPGLNHLVLGIGINVHQERSDFLPDIQGRAASLRQLTNIYIDRPRIADSILRQFNRYFSDQEVAGWLDEWKSHCAMLGSRITARQAQQPITGVVLDVDPLHGLLLRDDHGAPHFLSAQTTTLSA